MLISWLSSEIFTFHYSIGTGFGRVDELGEVTILENNTSIQISSSMSIVCATDKSTSVIEWSYRMGTSNIVTIITELTEFNTVTGFSILTIEPTDPGYYSCHIDSTVSYELLVLDPSSSICKYKIILLSKV